MSDGSNVSQDVIKGIQESDISIKAQHTAPGDVLVPINDAKDEQAGAQERKLQPEREATFKDYVRVFSYARKWDAVLMVIAAVAAISSGVTMPIMNVVFGKLVNGFNNYFTPGAASSKDDFTRLLNRQALYIFILFLARFALNYMAKFSFRIIGIRMSAAIRLDYLRCLFGQTIHVLDSMPSGAAAGVITTSANTLQIGISDKLSTFIEYTSTVISATIIAYTYSWRLALATSSLLLFILLTVGMLLPAIMKVHSKMTVAEEKASSVANETFGSIRMVTACGAEGRVYQRFEKWAKEVERRGVFLAPMIALQFGIIFFALYATFALAFWFGSKLFIEGHIDNVGTIIIVLMSTFLMVMSFERIANPMVDIAKASVAAGQFLAVIDAPRPANGTLQNPDITAADDIVFSDVHFAYPGRPHIKILDGLNLRVETGKVTAIVGPSGSGKSTIIGLIERWYTLHDQHIIAKTIEKDKMKKKKKKAKKGEKDEDEEINFEEDKGPVIELKGQITTNGHSLDEVDVKWWRAQIGLVQQEPFLFNDTIENNVRYGLVGTEYEKASDEVQRELVISACKEAFADEFIDRLPEKYDTQVGESGLKLSGGQRQRLSIARSIVKKPKILILDEATSAIDVRGERIVQAALDKVSKNRTTITIAHRLSTIMRADKIVVLQKGRVVEEGTHETLLERNGAYAGLVYAQQLSLGDQTEQAEAVEGVDTVLSRTKSISKSDTEATKHEEYQKKSLIHSFGLLLFELKAKWPSFFAMILISMCVAVSLPLQAWLFAKVITIFQDPFNLGHNSRFWSLMWTVLAIGTGISYFSLGFVAMRTSVYVTAVYQKQYFSTMLHQKIAFFDDDENSTGSLTARLASDVKQLEELMGMNAGMVLVSLFTVIGGLAIAYSFGWKLALVATCVTLPIGLGAGYFRIKYEIEFDEMNAAVFSESSKFAAESIGAFRTVCSFSLEDKICDRYNNLLRNHVLQAFKKARFSTLIFALADSLSLACQALIFWYGGQLLASREYNAMQFFVCFMAVIFGAESAGQGLSFGPNAAQVTGASNRILKARESQIHDTISNSEVIPDTEGGIALELRDVHFKYPTRDISIFKGLNLQIEKGQFAALVGASGCGKTSIISMLERFYDPQSGTILANGKDITDINVYEYRKYLSLVAQEAMLFQGTIRENVLLGVDPEGITDDQLHQACRDAYLHDFITSLSHGYETPVGNKGVSLSGGQKQRLSIARALIRNPKVLLLDEATSSLDSESEKQVQAAFERAGKGRTMVVVAHRLATVQNADVIFVLGEGKLLEKGNHAELLKKKGVYWHMCVNQALDR
ncbi:P-loop containing nucleoside triphosphate hydrolase protein [Microthyrium microscopicum]|uniref:P-loop containing nucleoside triphosphate hydrolase protein n=1 Tax=Microthyrium microscopicum TaxID=703497 RepID=A0A6A6U2F7_9PEZI|nr:P-loop containing nucleoside triphosphate hydrolase protein [Microthyrium microscopicum]